VGIPTTEEEMTTINNKVTQAFSPCKDTSVHMLRMLPPIGLGVMDVPLDIAQRRIKMATDTLHSNDVEGSALRWCLRVLQLVHHVPHFWWSDPRVLRTGTVRGFAEGVTQSLTVWETPFSAHLRRSRPDGRRCRGPKGRGSRCEAARAAIRFGGQVREDVLKCTIAPGFCPKGGPEVGLIFPLLSLSLFPLPLIPHPPISAQSWEPGCKVYVTGT
jgi:hypothetical protein